jgi:hypothetical protein
MTGHAVGQLQKPEQKWVFRFHEFHHVNRTLVAAQNSAESDHQKFTEIMQTRIAPLRILQTFPTTSKLLHGIEVAPKSWTGS